MEQNEKITVRTHSMVENYFFLVRNLPDHDKLALISKISNSMVHGKNKKKRDEEILVETYGCFQSEQTADEIIDAIYSSRHFREKDYQL